MKRIIYFGCSLLMTTVLATAFARPLLAQDDASAYLEYYGEQDQARKAALGEKFVADFKTSQWVDPVYRGIVNIYYKANNWAKVMDLAGKLEQLDPTTEAKNKEQVYTLAMGAAQNSNNPPQTIVFAEKVLVISPENLNALITVATTIPIASPNDKAAIQKAEGYAAKALTLLPKSDQFSDEQKVSIQGMLHNTLGSFAFNRQDYEKSIEEMTTATKLTPKDGNSWYLLGFSYYQQAQDLTKKALDAINEYNDMVRRKVEQAVRDEAKGTSDAFQDASREKKEQAMAALAVAVNCGGTTQQPAMQQLTKLWKNKNNDSTAGLDEYIKSKKPAQ